MTFCPYLSKCSGCHFERQSYLEQILSKKNHLMEVFKQENIIFPEIQIKSLAENHLRTRFDFTIENKKRGLYDFNKNIIDIKICSQITHELQTAFNDFHKVDFSIYKGSVRLRIGPEQQRGAWLDFANLDIKNLLNEKKSLIALLELGFLVEIGQKGKSLVSLGSHLKLSEPVERPWFQTKLIDHSEISLKCLISSFTQPSWVSANAITDIIQRWIFNDLSHPLQQLNVAEFGAGIGQFTLPLLSAGHQVDVFESHQQAAQFLKINASHNHLSKNLNIFIGDFQKNPIPHKKKYHLALVNPPRSGLKNFVHELIQLNTAYCMYISCFPETLAIDLKKLKDYDFIIKELVIVDQFPQTKHFETCVLLQRVNFKT